MWNFGRGLQILAWLIIGVMVVLVVTAFALGGMLL